MLQIALQYTLPRMKQATNEVSEDLPLFINQVLEEKQGLEIFKSFYKSKRINASKYYQLKYELSKQG